LELLKQVARAISKAHQLGIVHRDLKPDNIFLCHGDEDEFTAKMLDFGIAKSTNPLAGSASDSKTRTGALMGTPYYMSPEQIQGTKNVDFRADLWALGVIVFECLTGFRPFDDEALGALLLKICSGPIPVPSQYGSVPDGFDAWFGRAVHRNPSERFGSVTEMAKAFEALLGGTPRADEAERQAEPERVSVTARTALGNSVGSDSLVGIFGTIRRSGGRRVTIAAIVATLVLTSAVGFVFLRGKSGAPPIAAVSGSAPVAEPAVQPSSAEGESKPEATPANGASAASPPAPSPSGETASLEAPVRKRPSAAQAARSAKEPKPATENPPVATVPPPTRKVEPSDPLTKRH
jgi:serine/threonine-protein kinase